MAITVQFRTESERIIAGYLNENGYSWDYEAKFPGTDKRPDFRVHRRGAECLIDAKERLRKTAPPGARGFDPIKGLRHSIAKGRETFKDFNDNVCLLVLYNNGDCDTRLSPWHVFGAIRGDPGLTADFNASTGQVDMGTACSVFLDRGGKMVRHYDPFEVYESAANISAIVLLRQISLRTEMLQAEVRAEVEANNNSRQHKTTEAELVEIVLAVGGRLGADPRLVTQLRVCENPYARRSPPADIFDGPYDERWRWTGRGDEIERLFAGTEIQATNPDKFAI